MLESLPSPKKLSGDELTKSEHEQGDKLPDYIVPLRVRVRTPEMQQAYALLEKRTEDLRQQLYEAYPHPATYSPDKLTDIWQRVENDLVGIAADARQFADQYRQFNVGATIIGYRNVEPSENPWVVLFDANTKPETVMGAVRKHCAELYLSDRIDPERPEMGLPEEKMEKALALFLVAESKTDDDSKKTQITLTCCKLCRDRLWKLSQKAEGVTKSPIVTPDMPVVSANVQNLGLRKLQQVQDLHRFHGELPPGYEAV